MLTKLARLKVDERVVRVLSSYNISGDLSAIAKRGARYCLPGWFQETQQKNGKLRVSYLEPHYTQTKAHEFLAGAKTTADICGRVISLLVMALYADEDAVAQSNRAFFTLNAAGHYGTHGVPWAPDAETLLETLAEERLPESLTSARKQKRLERERITAQQAKADAARERAHNDALRALENATNDERQAILDAYKAQHGWHGHHELTARAQQLSAAETEHASQQDSEESVPASN